MIHQELTMSIAAGIVFGVIALIVIAYAIGRIALALVHREARARAERAQR